MTSTITVKIGDIQKNIPAYVFETTQTFLSRVAAEFKTLPKFLYSKDTLSVLKSPLVLNNLLDDASDNTFVDLYNQTKQYIEEGKLKLNDIILLSILNSDIDNNYAKMIIENDIKTNNLADLVDMKSIEDIIDNKENEEKTLEYLIESNIKDNKRRNKLFNTFYQEAEDFETTDFFYEYIKVDLYLENRNLSLMEIFNNIKTNVFVPIANVKKLNNGGGSSTFFKMNKDVMPYEEWSTTDENKIILQVLEKTMPLKLELEDYSPVYISTNEGKVVMNLEIMLSKITQEDYVKRVKSSFVDDYRISESSVKNITGTYNIINQTFDKHVLAELVMNSVLNKFSVINESKSATKTKNSIFIYFDIPNIGKAKVNFTPKYVTKKNFIKGYEIGTPYIRIRVKEVETQDKLDLLLQFIKKMFTYYNKKYDSIVKFYKQFIPDFGKEVEMDIEIEDKTTLKKIAPELFVSGYSGQCSKNKNPTIIQDEEVKKYTDDGYQVMVYPKLEDPNAKSRNYICTDEKYNYPGLQKNNLSNKDIFQYLPCCFSKDQQELAGSNYRNYYLDEVAEKTDEKKRYILQSNKTVSNGEIAVLPENINDLFRIINKDDNLEFLRKGVRRSPNSFIECVISALGYEIPTDMKKIRKGFANSQKIGACRQEMYDYSVLEILKLLNGDSYFDPKLFIHILEERFDCNIILFSSVKNPNGEMITPRFTEGYYQNYNENPYVFVYENGGSKVENLTYPQCEIILNYNKTILTGRNIQESFVHDEYVVTELSFLFDKLVKAYSLDKKIEKSKINFQDYSSVINQVIDVNGKCRTINFNFKENVVTLYTSPIQPMSLETILEYSENKVNPQVALEFAEYLGIVITNQSVDKNNNIKFLNGLWSNVRVSIPTTEEPKYSYLPYIDADTVFKDTVESTLSNFIENQKKARYIDEYFIWFYSIFLNDNNLDTNIKSIVSFVEEKILVLPGFVYGKIDKIFSVDNPILTRGGKLILNSGELLKRLIFNLKLGIVRDNNNIRNYYKNLMIQQYYTNVTDFTKYQNQVVLEGEDSVGKFLIFNNDKKILNYKIQPEVKKPYFFKNNIIDEGIVLAQNTNSFDYAKQLGCIWNNEDYNNFPEKTTYVEPDNILFYKYVNNSNITAYNIAIGASESKTDEVVPSDVKIIGYKVNNKPGYTAIFDISST